MSGALSISSRVRGVVVPMITPVLEDGSADLESVDRIVDHLLEGGIDGVFLFGTTGEGLSVSREVRRTITPRVVQRVNRRVQVYVGISAGLVEEAAENARHAAEHGADFVVAHMPWWRVGPASMVEAFFTRLAERSSLPLVLYNIPAITRGRLEPEGVARLARLDRVVGLKDSEASLQHQLDVLAAISRVGGKPASFPVLLGAMKLLPECLEHPYAGIVPSSANLDPQLYADLWRACELRDRERFLSLCDASARLGDLYQSGADLGESLRRLKEQMSVRGLCRPNLLLG